MSTWTIEVENSATGYDADTPIPRPNQDMELKITSTQQKVSLANGGVAFINPEVKRLKESFDMYWAETTSAFRTQIENYIINGDKVKITTHTGETFIGRFLGMSRVWFTGVAPDAFDVRVSFERVE